MIEEVMHGRRSVRRFKPDSPPRALVERLLEAAVTAPSASNQQPWRFVVVSSPAVRARMAEAVRAAVDRIARHVTPAFEAAFRGYGDYFTRFEGAPIVIVALYRPIPVLSQMVDERLPGDDRASIEVMEENSGIVSAALAVENMLLLAHDVGLGASGMTGPLVALPGLRVILEVPPSWRIAALVPVGYPDETPGPTTRKPAQRVTRWIE